MWITIGYRRPAVVRTLALAILTFAGMCSRAQTIDFTPIPQVGLVVHAVVNGKAGDFMFDTGEGLSAVTPEFAGKIGCSPWGQATGFRMSGEAVKAPVCNGISVKVSDVTANVDTVQVVDINKFLPPGTQKIDGALGLDLFEDKVFSFSQRRRQLVISDSAPESLAGCQSLPIHVVRDAEGLALSVNLPVRTSAGTAWFEMDSGNASPYTLVNKAIATTLGLKPDVASPQASSVVLGDGQIVETKALVLDLILDGNLGTNFLSAYDVTVDLKHRRAWLIPEEHQKCPARK